MYEFQKELKKYAGALGTTFKSTMGALGIYSLPSEIHESNSIKKVYTKQDLHELKNFKKQAFIQGLKKSIDTIYNFSQNNKVVNKLNSIPVILGTMWAGSKATEFKESRDRNFLQYKNSKQQARQQNPAMYSMQKTGNAFDETLEKIALKMPFPWTKNSHIGTLGKAFIGLGDLAFAGSTLVGLNNIRKNIQYAAPKVPKITSVAPHQVPQRPLNTNMYNNGAHPSTYQNTYTK